MSQETRQKARGIYFLPNLFTLIALFAGFYAIIMSMRAEFINAAIAIFVAMILDSLDGRVARMTQTQTDFGAQLDSLSDMISFGMAPAILVYSYSLLSLGKLGWLSAFVYAVAVALRLAKFNSTAANLDKKYFRGLASPPGAAMVTSLVWFSCHYQFNPYGLRYLIMSVSIITALLMVSNLPYRSFKDLNLRDRVPFFAILALVLVIVLIALRPPEMLLLIAFVYGLSAPLFWAWRRLRLFRRKRKHKRDKQANKRAAKSD